MSRGPITLRMAGRAVECRAEPLPDATCDAAASVLLDWCGVAVGGGVEQPARLLRAALGDSPGDAELAGAGGRTGAPTAALVNGTAAHTLELDDIYAPGTYHPGAPSVAAALAVAQAEGVTGETLVRGLVVGFEIGNRVAQTLGPSHYASWHTTGTAGSVTAAAAVAEVLGLDEERFASALALAATMAAGLQQTFRTDSMGKPLHSGHAAHNGVVAGLAAARGFTGTLDVLDGEIGMGAVMSSSPSWEAAGEPFGPDHLIRRTTVKPYPCCGHTFAAVDAALDLVERGLRADEVETVEVATYAAALDVAGIADPATTYEAKFSLPFVVAHALGRGRLDLSAFTEEALADPTTRDLRSRVGVTADAAFTDAFPARRGGRVVVTTKGGERLTADVPDRRGDPSNPLPPERLREKFRGLAQPVLGAETASDLERSVAGITDLDDVRRLPLGPR